MVLSAENSARCIPTWTLRAVSPGVFRGEIAFGNTRYGVTVTQGAITEETKAAAIAQGPLIVLKDGESADLNTVYWIDVFCVSFLNKIDGVDIIESPPNVTLAIRREAVMALRQGCPNPVPGGMVFATAKGIKAQQSGKLVFRVRYDTTSGPKQSTFTYQMVLLPTPAAP